MAPTSPARWLAPLALVAAALALVLVVNGSLSSEGGDDDASAPATRTTGRERTRTRERPASRGRARTYVVQAGDSLSAVSVRTGVSVERLRALNPAVEPDALRVGQRLRLEPPR